MSVSSEARPARAKATPVSRERFPMHAGHGGAWPVFNPTRRATHQRPGTAGVESAGGTGGHGRASRSTTPSLQARVWRSRGRPGPTAPGTPEVPQATSSIANSGCGARGRRRGQSKHTRPKPRPIVGRRGACGAWPGFEPTRPGAAGVEGAGGTGGHGRASRRGAERSEAA